MTILVLITTTNQKTRPATQVSISKIAQLITNPTFENSTINNGLVYPLIQQLITTFFIANSTANDDRNDDRPLYKSNS
jgi:hypothetical protein